MTIDESLDALLDLKHDLGKYLRLPLAVLPVSASETQVRDAVRMALLETRRGPTGTRSAGDLWQAFLAEVGGALTARDEWPGLCSAVERALAWETVLAGPGQPIARDDVVRDFAGVTEAIQRLVAGLRQEDL